MKISFRKVNIVVLGITMAVSNAAMADNALGGFLPQAVQGALQQATKNEAPQAAAQAAESQGTQSALSQAAQSLLPLAVPALPNAAPANQIQPSPALTSSSEASFFSKSGLQACGGGAVTGLIACKLTNTCDSKKGATQAAILGCGIGIGANYYLDYQRSQYSNSEQRLDALIADVQADNSKLQTLTATAQQVLKEDKTKLAAIQQGIKSKTLQKAQAQSQIAQVDANTQYLNKSLSELKTRQQQWQEVAKTETGQSAKAEALNAEISRMQKQIVTLQQSVDSVAQQRATVVLG